MDKIGIVTEVPDLPQEFIGKHNIELVPVKLDWPDLESMPGKDTFEKMRELKKRNIQSTGKTSQPSPKDFLEAYKKQFERFEKILCITVTSKLSGTYNSAVQAVKFLPKEQQDRVFIIDSLSASCAEGLMVLKALDMMRQGREAGEIAEELKKLVPSISLFMMFEDSKYLEASGRISSLAGKILRQAMNMGIRPLLAMRKGLLVPAGMKIGAKDIASALFQEFGKEVKKKNQENKKLMVTIAHGDFRQGADRLKAMIEREYADAEVAAIGTIDNILGTLVGPDSLIIGWVEK